MTDLDKLIAAPRTLPSQGDLLQLLDYNPETGAMLWRRRSAGMASLTPGAARSANRWSAQWAGKPAISAKNSEGYLAGRLLGYSVRQHRVIWKYMTGEDARFIDHVNGQRDDNRWCNLRSVEFADNVKNAKLRSDNKTGKPGVRLDTRDGKYYATGKQNGKAVNLGRFADLEAAVAARASWEVNNGFHQNHGRQA